jgi:hypothetical protein
MATLGPAAQETSSTAYIILAEYVLHQSTHRRNAKLTRPNGVKPRLVSFSLALVHPPSQLLPLELFHKAETRPG